MVHTTWVWFGNEPQINTNPFNAPTNAQASTLNGKSAEGVYDAGPPASGMQSVDLDGRGVTNGTGGNPSTFRHTYQADGTRNPPAATSFSYTTPSGTRVPSSTMTGVFTTRVTMISEDGVERTLNGQIMQMSNGDLFFRPTAADIPRWNAANPSGTLSSVSFANTTPVLSNFYLFTTPFKTKIADMVIPCFTTDTLIRTARGDVAVQDLRVGDTVATADRGDQSILWIKSRTLDRAALARHPNLRPVRIAAGALGAGLPRQDLLVSPQHRILVRSKIAIAMFDTAEVLVAAKQLLDIPGITIAEDVEDVTYWHFLCDGHQVVYANGAMTETLYTGSQALKSVGHAAREEILTLFPELRDQSALPAGARTMPKGQQARKLAERHARHGRSLVGAV